MFLEENAALVIIKYTFNMGYYHLNDTGRSMSHLGSWLTCQTLLRLEILVISNHTSLVPMANPTRPNSIACGLNGQECEPFTNRTFAFRCPATCGDFTISTPETIGDQKIKYRNIAIGGPLEVNDTSIPIYCGDSFICGAAIHAGLIDNQYGGAGTVSLIGEQRNFPSVQSNGILSIRFDSSFPLAFTFLEGGQAIVSSGGRCQDPRWTLLAISVLFSSFLSICTTSPAVFFGSVLVEIYFSVALALDPIKFSNSYSMISGALGNFVPAAAVGFIVYYYCVTYTLRNLTAQFEKTILWLGFCWAGALNNFTFDRLPLQRLTPHDLIQPGAIMTVVVIAILLFLLALGQAWAFRIEGRMPLYLASYGMVGLVLLAFIAVPNMNLRLHHYIIAMLLLPGTKLQTRPSLAYQGLLVGLFINGIARWGFASILQTPAEFFGNNYSGVVPHMPPPLINGTNLAFSWANITAPFDSISILVNDVQRFGSYADSALRSFTYTRYHTGEPAYFRFAYILYLELGGALVLDYGKPGTWAANGSWFQ